MADLLATGAAWLADQLADHAGRALEYSRGSDTCEVQGTVSRVEREYLGGYGQLVKVESWDVIVKAESLVLSSGQVDPQPGDRFTEVGERNTKAYEVMTPDGQKQCFQFVGGRNVLLKVHCKLVSVA